MIIEMALVLPLLIFMGLAGLELVNLTLTQTRLSQLALTAADNASRIAVGNGLSLPRVREVDVNEVFTGVGLQGSGLNFARHGRLILSSLETNSDGGQRIQWQRCFGELVVPSSYGVEGDGRTGTALKGMGPSGNQISAIGGAAVMFVEVFYDYQPMIYGAWLGPRRLHTTAAYNIREGRDLTKIYNDAPFAPVLAC
ncbi:TadE/TadG family type IV pilus assembly protein [Sphingopyxis yananensis]|uniref:TadE/TadG family type IV pilus assembly protein n=1 Tax=Sphingopyxis yananensis TaxID=2886687 RepID=UPI002A5ACA47|nr:TadE family protein [Sphingopyxis yananensis]